ncbi:hypothetical protein F5X71_23515 [Nocardia brasiliensis]|uniref:Alpha/beta hydrolase n=1 Tax=Nocardia brasiliensis TaxID=37326 RepID=A0A6G9XVC4_NOCBR|nr:hypothetical protein [Nocardia brasiliensis]QIS04902.1 hypothetical protein F5X71_23515 [Nocardia brasiliensis]
MATEARIDVKTLLQKAAGDLRAPELYELARIAEAGPWFGMPAARSGEAARPPEFEWPLVSEHAYLGKYGRGTAAVHLGNGHERLVNPMIFADGFGYGPSDLDGLWQWFNEPYSDAGERLFDQLLAAGIDIVLLGFDARHDYIQVNAGVARACIAKVIAERQSKTPLITGGVSMGGQITRYALAAMERADEAHETETYLSWDSPHNGAWIPLILQQMAYFFESFEAVPPGKASKAGLIRSPAAQQLLCAWVADSRYSGPVATASPLRAQFVQELADLGGFPQRPVRLGLANGRGDGQGVGLTPGEIAFDKKFLGGLVGSATARFQPAFGEQQPVGGMHLGLTTRTTTTTAVAPFDGAPGGLLDSFGQVATTLGIDLAENKRWSCFVPSISAIALDYDPITWEVDLDKDLRSVPPEQTALTEFCCNATNSEHSAVTPTLAEWVLRKIAK